MGSIHDATDLHRVAFPKCGRAHPPIASLAAQSLELAAPRAEMLAKTAAVSLRQKRMRRGVRRLGRLGKKGGKSEFCASEVMEVSTLDSIA